MAKSNTRKASETVSSNTTDKEVSVDNMSTEQREILEASEHVTDVTELPDAPAEGDDVPFDVDVVGKPENPVIAAMARQEEINRAAIAESGTATEQALVAGQDKPKSAEQVLQEEIILNFHPEHSDFISAAADARETLAQMADTKNELEGTQQSRMTQNLADLGYALMKKGQLTVGPMMYRDLIARLKERPDEKTAPALGEVIELKDTSNTANLTIIESKETTTQEDGSQVINLLHQTSGATVDTISPYGRDIKTVANVNPAAMRACLLLAGHKTEVVFGYIPKDEVRGKRFTKVMAFLRRDQIDETRMSSYFKAACIPNYVISPYVWTTNTIDGVVHFEPAIEIDEATGKAMQKRNRNDTLRYLTEEYVQALYQFHIGEMGKGKLHYDVVGKSGKGNPTGLLIRKPIERAAQQQGSNEKLTFNAGDLKNATQIMAAPAEQAKEYVSKLLGELKDARELVTNGQPISNTFGEHVNVLANLLGDPMKRRALPDAAMACCIRIARMALTTIAERANEGKTVGDATARELVLWDREYENRVWYDDEKDAYFLLADSGNPVGGPLKEKANGNNGNGNKQAA